MTSIELPALYIGRVSLIADSPRLALINRDPCPGEAGVPIDSTIALELVDTESSDLAHESVRVWIDDDLAFDGRNAPAFRGRLEKPKPPGRTELEAPGEPQHAREPIQSPACRAGLPCASGRRWSATAALRR